MVLLCAACTPAQPATTPGAPSSGAPSDASPPMASGQPHPEHGEHGRRHGEHGHGYHKDFSDAAGFSAHFDDPARDAWQRPGEVIEHLRIPTGSTVADLGAGTGYFIAALSRSVGPSGKVLALDVEPKMVEFLARRAREQQLANVEPKLVQPDDPGLPPHALSRILIVNTWHHIDDRAAYARRLAGALYPGGEIWIVDFTPDSDLGPPPEHRLEAGQVVAELEAGGLDAVVVEPEALPKQYLVRARARP